MVRYLILLLTLPSVATAQPRLSRRQMMIMGASRPIPFVMEFASHTKAFLVNGQERIPLHGQPTGDSVIYPLHVFDAELRLRISNNPAGIQSSGGTWVRLDAAPTRRNIKVLPMSTPPHKSKTISGLRLSKTYKVTFTKANGGTYPSIAHFQVQPDGQVLGSFETKTGDYRYLSGRLDGDSLRLSCFDGSHAFLFVAKALRSSKKETFLGDSLAGKFYTPSSDVTLWTALSDADASLPDALSLSRPITDAPVDMTVTDTAGLPVHLSDPAFAGKALILQVMGTWCPNCMDETAYLTSLYPTRPAGLEFVGLAFERKPDRAYWASRLARVRRVQKVPYPMYYAGPANNDSASARLPFISRVEAFPTTIFLDRLHRVRYVHTGFSGPATGEAYEASKKEFIKLIEEITKN